MRFLIILLLSHFVFAQIDSSRYNPAEFDEEATALVEVLNDLRDNPVHLNQADRETLLRIPFLDGEAIDTLLRFRRLHGPIKAYRRLKKLWGRETYKLVRPYITLKPAPYPAITFYQKNYYKSDPGKDFEQKYDGNVLYSYSRLRYRHSRELAMGLVLQKDPGERLINDLFHLALWYRKQRWTLLAGDYYLRFGQGLAFAPSFAPRKSFNPRAVLNRDAAIRIRENLTSAESQGFFGIASQVNLYGQSLFLFYSDDKKDAALRKGQPYALLTDGYHRNAAELKTRKNLRQRFFGAGLSTTPAGGLSLAMMAAAYRFSPELDNSAALLGDPLKRRQYFSFSGNSLGLITLAYAGRLSSTLTLSGEAAYSGNKGLAGAHTLFYASPDFNSGLHIWYASNNFQSPDGKLFDNNSPFPRGEWGYYLTLGSHPLPNLEISGYKLFRQKLWRDYFNLLPVNKSEAAIQLYGHIREHSLLLRYRFIHDADYAGTRLETRAKNNLRLEFQQNKDGWKQRSRLEYMGLSGGEQGWLFFHDIRHRPAPALSFILRLTFFNTTSYGSRLYEYEPDLPGAFANFPLYGQGYKWNVLIRYNPFNGIKLWLKGRYLRKLNDTETRYYTYQYNREVRLGVQLKY